MSTSRLCGMLVVIFAAVLIVGGFVAECVLKLQGMLPLYGILAILICALVAICVVTYGGKAIK